MAGKGKGLFTSRVDNRDVTASARGRKTNPIVSEVAPVVEEGSIHSWNDDDFAEADRVVEEIVEEVEQDGSHESCGSRLKVRRVEKGRWGRASEDSSSSIVAPKKKKSGKDTSWIITDPVPGGPLVSHVIPSFGGHIAQKLWDTPKDGGRPVLTGYHRFGPLADHLWDNWEDHRVHLISRSEPANFPRETTKEYKMWFQTVSHPFIIDPDHLDALLPRDAVVVNIETANALLDQFAVARRIEDDAEQLKFFRRMMKDIGPLIDDHRLSRRKPSKGPTPSNRVQREADGLRYDDSEKD
ncbi:hypothetical protein KSS87_011180 [Heliosperma pusillum]|nr:hypothetical protein KSS87_014320 [Heliosperma pusillum]KAH9621945.1 hypothetical protein KSS87_011180 [Heliosperma pusillum]